MTLPAPLAVSAKPPAASGFRGVLHTAVQHISWRVIGATVAIALALDVWLIFDVIYSIPKLPAAERYLSGSITNLFVAFGIMFTTLVADERVAQGAKRLPTYAWAVVIGSAAAAFAQWIVLQGLHLHTRNDVAGIPHEVTVMQPAFVFFEYLIWGSIIVFIYVNRRGALLAKARMNAAQVQRADAQRRTLESRLRALQARIEPQFLFNTLARVQALYDSDPAKASQMLGDLIVYLRAALPRLRDSTSTLGQEMDLVEAYWNIMRVHLGEHRTFHVDVPDAARTARTPPMVLLPLINQVLVDGFAPLAGSGTIRIAARSAGGKLRVEIAVGDQGFAPRAKGNDLHDIEDRLHALYGREGTLTFEPSGSHGTQVVMEIPHESTDGNHR